MQVIAFISGKGGVGKTTLAVNVAVALAQRKKRVLLIDLDPQNAQRLHLVKLARISLIVLLLQQDH